MSFMGDLTYDAAAYNKTSKNPAKVIIVLFLTSIITYFVISKGISRLFEPNLISPLPNNSGIQISPAKKNDDKGIIGIFNKKPKNYSPEEILQKIDQQTQKTSGTYSVYIFDINKNTGFGINEQMVTDAASVNKITIIAALYYLAGTEDIDLEKIVVPQPKDISDGTGSIRYDPPGTPYSIKTLARLMMEKSDNTAAYILGSHIVGLQRIQDLVGSWGLTQTDMFKNTSSVKDQAKILIKVYKGEITSHALTAEMLDFMNISDFDDRLPKGLPEGVKIFHKTGDQVGKIHDVGIIEAPDRPYYLGVFTTDQTNEQTTKDNIAQISKIVYEYLGG